MLLNSREYSDGQFTYALIPMKDMGNVVILEDIIHKKVLKKYFTEDDEASVAIFESMIDCQFNEGDENLRKYSVLERLSSELTNRIRIDVE